MRVCVYVCVCAYNDKCLCGPMIFYVLFFSSDSEDVEDDELHGNLQE